ncbi:hypothetical protein HanPI659440_Chr00c15g0727471 [Helianthus annuus]|nr:hypothetical protein HanPI659440_Chr00c15g0727471 [Helianthus annuus]
MRHTYKITPRGATHWRSFTMKTGGGGGGRKCIYPKNSVEPGGRKRICPKISIRKLHI